MHVVYFKKQNNYEVDMHGGNHRQCENKYGKYLAIGGFAFFFIKGLIWLAVIFSVGFSAFNLI